MTLDIARLMLFSGPNGVRSRERPLHHDDLEPVSLALIAGFLVFSGIGLHDMLLYIGAGAAVLVVGLCLLRDGLEQRRNL